MRPRLLFVYLKPTSFVQDDLALLQQDFEVRAFHFDIDTGAPRGAMARDMARAFRRQRSWLRAELPHADAVLGWFADYHLIFPVQAAHKRRIPSAIIVGGYDGNTYPEVGYGVMASRWRAPLARRVLRQADHLIPVSHSLVSDTNAYLDPSMPRHTGLCASMPDLQTPHTVVPLGVDPEAWPAGPARREPVVTTVAFLANHRTVTIKGVDLLVEAARALPAVRVEIVGVEAGFREAFESAYRPPANVTLLPPMPREVLAPVYQRASVYAQLSRMEAGLPMVLAEAMRCGCVPVGSRVGGIPETIGEAGFLVDQPDPAAIATTLQTALEQPANVRDTARERIGASFTLAQRGERLSETIHGLIASKRRAA